jgi:hypothetical protein
VNRDLLLLILSAAVKSRITDGRVFPRLAEALIGKGIESPATVELVVLGTEPFDPRDARELAGQMLSELGVSVPTDNVAADVIGGLAALALEWGWITPRTLTHLAAQLIVNLGYPKGSALSHLYAVDDEWDAGWALGNDAVEAVVRDMASEVLTSIPGMIDVVREDPDWDLLIECLPGAVRGELAGNREGASGPQ